MADDLLSALERSALDQAVRDNPSYRLAWEDPEFLMGDDLRAVRLQLELIKPEQQLRRHKVRSTVVVFGSARVLPPAQAQTAKQIEYARYYEEARRFAQIVSLHFQQQERRDFVVVTGGGPGIMEAANRGAHDAGGRSIGLNITLPNEQVPNPFVTPDLCFRFRYFALRKMHFLLRAKAMVAFPGGYGTLDELFETLALVQTGKVERMPIVLFGTRFWRRAVDFEFLVEEGMISREDASLFTVVDRAEDAVAALQAFYRGVAPT